MTLSYNKDSSFSVRYQDILEDQIQIAIHDIFVDCFQNPTDELSHILVDKEEYRDFYESNLRCWEAKEDYKKCSKLKKLYERNLLNEKNGDEETS